MHYSGIKRILKNGLKKLNCAIYLFLTGGLRAARSFPEDFSTGSFGGFHSATVVVWGHTGSSGGGMCDDDDDDGGDDGGDDDDGDDDDGDDDDVYVVASSSPPMQVREFVLESNVFPEQTKQLLVAC